jgi:hypothetical protein
MRHHSKIITMLLGVLSVTFICCQRDSAMGPEKDNKIESWTGGAKTSNTYNLFVRTGHDGAKCSGCVVRNGTPIHVDCQGYGSQCGSLFSAHIDTVAGVIRAVTTDTFGLTSLDFFNMPDRSLSTGESGNNAYLNIPAQLVERDTATLQFTFTGLFYTNKPEYNNF